MSGRVRGSGVGIGVGVKSLDQHVHLPLSMEYPPVCQTLSQYLVHPRFTQLASSKGMISPEHSDTFDGQHTSFQGTNTPERIQEYTRSRSQRLLHHHCQHKHRHYIRTTANDLSVVLHLASGIWHLAACTIEQARGKRRGRGGRKYVKGDMIQITQRGSYRQKQGIRNERGVLLLRHARGSGAHCFLRSRTEVSGKGRGGSMAWCGTRRKGRKGGSMSLLRCGSVG